MTFAEILKAKGVANDVAQAILDDMKANKIFTSSEENLDIRYGKLKTDHDSLSQQYAEAQKLIEDLKKSSKGQDGLQEKIADYEAQIGQLQAQLAQTQIDSAIKVGLLSEKALDVDYLTFKLKEKGSLELDDQGKIKGWDDKIAALKTQLPGQFEGTGKKTVLENKLPEDNGKGSEITKEAFTKMGYQERVKLFNENPDAYAELAKG
ncbi:phage scaffolding protein [Treponema sp.]|uniref:phage scaffolding protein n=1 Tax=Treponema sp. TaxID=166 RepID=UPI00388EED54